MRNTEYKYKPFRVPASVLSPKPDKEPLPAYQPHSQILSNQEERHLQRKVQELVWFFQNGNKSQHTKKSASGSIKTTPLRQHQTLTSAQSASSLEECASRKQMNSLRAAIKSSTPARNQREWQPPVLNTKQNEQFSVNSGHHSSRSTTKRSVGSMSQIMPFNKASTNIYSGISKLAIDSRNKSSSTSTQISYKSSPYSTKPQRPAVHHYSLNKAEDPPSLLMPQELSSVNDDQHSKIQQKRKSNQKLRGHTNSENKLTAATEESPVQKRIKKKSSEKVIASGPGYIKGSLSKKRNSETRIGVHQPPKRTTLVRKKSHQHNITYDESQLKEVTQFWEPRIQDASKEDRCTPIKPRLPSGKQLKPKLDTKIRDQSEKSVRSGSCKTSLSPKRSQMIHFAFFKDHSNVKYGCVPVDDNSIQHPSKAFKSFVKSMGKGNEAKLSPRESIGSEVVYEQISGRVPCKSGIASDRSHNILTGRELKSTKHQKSLGGTKPQLQAQFLDDFDIFGRKGSARASGDYFNPHPRSPYKKEIEKAFQAQLSDRVPDQGLTARQFRLKPVTNEEFKEDSSVLASRNYMPSVSPDKLVRSPGSDLSDSKSKRIDATPVTAVGEDSSFERCIQDTPPPIKGRLYGDDDIDSSEPKKPKPFSYFGNKVGGIKQIKGQPIGEAIQECAAESEITLLGSVNQSARNTEVFSNRGEAILTPRKKLVPRQTQETPKASLSTDQQSFTHQGDQELFQKVKILAKSISPSKYQDSPVQPQRYRERSLLESEALKFPTEPKTFIQQRGWEAPREMQKQRDASSSAQRVKDLLSSKELQVEVALLKKEKQNQVKKLGQDQSKRYQQGYQSGTTQKQEEVLGSTADFGKYEEPLESDRVVWEQIQNVKIEEEDKQGSYTNSLKDLQTFRGHIKKMSEGEDSDTTERIQRLSWLADQIGCKTVRVSQFKEVRQKMLSNLGNIRLFNQLREENQYRKHKERETTNDKLKELKMLIKVSQQRKGAKIVHIDSMDELPFSNSETQTEKVPELELFKWIKGKGGSKKNRARRVATYALALALLSMKRMMGE